jgi:hypothetical protein
MTAEFESIAEMLLLFLAVANIVIVIFLALLLRSMRRLAEGLGSGSAAPALQSPAPVSGPVPPPETGTVGRAEPVPPPGARTVELVEGSPDILGSIQRLCEKHGLSDFLITTLDGLVVVSRSPGSSEEAARFSDLYQRKKKPDSPGVTFLEISHRGERMLAVARSDRPLGTDQMEEIGGDARKILNWWL